MTPRFILGSLPASSGVRELDILRAASMAPTRQSLPREHTRNLFKIKIPCRATRHSRMPVDPSTILPSSLPAPR